MAKTTLFLQRHAIRQENEEMVISQMQQPTLLQYQNQDLS